VGLHRLVAQHEAFGDLLVRETRRDQAENLELAAGEGVEVFGTGALRRAEAGELGDQAPRDPGARSASPAATTRTASNSVSGGASLSRKPLAPAWRAS
jgi:hypothetical protein